MASSTVIDGKKIHEVNVKHDKSRAKFHTALLKLYPDKLTCPLCGYPLKRVRMTFATTLTVTIKSKMTMPIVIDTDKGERSYSKEFQKQLHEGIAQAIVSAIEHARDDEAFDQNALDDLYIDKDDFGIKGEPEISDFADVRLTYHHGKKTWIGDYFMTKAERNPKHEDQKHGDKKF